MGIASINPATGQTIETYEALEREQNRVCSLPVTKLL